MANIISGFPFSRGPIKNLIDFFGIRCFGLCRPYSLDWMSIFDLGDQDLNKTRTPVNIPRDNYQFV